MKRPVAIALISLLTCSEASAAYLSGNDVHFRCENNDQSFLLGFTGSLVDSFEQSAYAVILHKPGAESMEYSNAAKTFCTPGTVVLGQVIDIVCQYLENNPAFRDQTAVFLASESLRLQFPCTP